MNEAYIAVVTGSTKETILAYLYSEAAIVLEGSDGRRQLFVVRVSTNGARDALRVAQNQADRLNSGLHGAKVYAEAENAITHIALAYS